MQISRGAPGPENNGLILHKPDRNSDVRGTGCRVICSCPFSSESGFCSTSRSKISPNNFLLRYHPMKRRIYHLLDIMLESRYLKAKPLLRMRRHSELHCTKKPVLLSNHRLSLIDSGIHLASIPRTSLFVCSASDKVRICNVCQWQSFPLRFSSPLTVCGSIRARWALNPL